MKFIHALIRLFRPEPISPERRAWADTKKQPALIPVRILLHRSQAGENFVFVYKRHETHKLFVQLLRYQARPEVGWTPLDTACLLRDLREKDLQVAADECEGA